ncbi:hypothetical protein V8C26DRAFT_32762 [Trichoderma gracile]
MDGKLLGKAGVREQWLWLFLLSHAATVCTCKEISTHHRFRMFLSERQNQDPVRLPSREISHTHRPPQLRVRQHNAGYPYWGSQAQPSLIAELQRHDDGCLLP